MAYFPVNVLDNAIKAMPTVKAISNTPIATFDTDIADRLVSLNVAVTATGGGGTPVSPIAINGFSACNLSVNGTTHTINFGQTVYGGSLDVLTGKLTITHGYVDLSTLTWLYNPSYQLFYSPDDIGEYRGVGNLGLCEIYTVVDNVDGVSYVPATNYIICGYTSTSNHRIYIRNTDYTDETAFTNSMVGKYFAYRLANPTIVQLTSEEVNAIIGTNNNVYADTGDIIELKYQVSVGQAIS